jgi:hypothetical protein
MDGGIEQNPAYGTAQTFTYHDYKHRQDILTLIDSLTEPHVDDIILGTTLRPMESHIASARTSNHGRYHAAITNIGAFAWLADRA